jgi:hypothetical protein
MKGGFAMYFYPILLVKADSVEDAKTLAEDFCKTREHERLNFLGIVEDAHTTWNRPLLEVFSALPPDNHVEAALKFLSLAEEKLKERKHGSANYYCKKAGLLLEQSFGIENLVFNIRFNDYSRVFEDGWFAIEAEFRF